MKLFIKYKSRFNLLSKKISIFVVALIYNPKMYQI